MRFINKYAVGDSEEPTAGAKTADLTPRSGKRGKDITFCAFCSVCSTP